MSDLVQPPAEDIPSLWTQYEKLIDLQKFYFEPMYTTKNGGV